MGCADNKDQFAAYRSQTATQIYDTAQSDLIKGRYDRAVTGLEALDAIYPFGAHAERAQLYLMYAYYKNNDEASAVVSANRFLRLYPHSVYADYAHYLNGIIMQNIGYSLVQKHFSIDPAWRDLKNKKQAFMAFNEVVRYYPKSPYALDAYHRMQYLRQMIARQSLLLAQLYYDRDGYVAAINRAAVVVQHFDGTPSVVGALDLMVRAYSRLGLKKKAAYVQVALAAAQRRAVVQG